MKKAFVVCFFLLSLTAYAYPQSESPSTSLSASGVDIDNITIEEATSLALANSVEIRKTAVIIRDDETRLSEETALKWLSPNLSLRGGVDVETGQPQLSVGVGLDLKDIMGAGRKRIKTIKFSISEEKKNLDSIKAAITIRVMGGYNGYRSAREKLRTLEEILQNDERLISELEAKGSQVERLLIRSMVNQDKLSLITARQELETAAINLRELLGLMP